MLILLLLCNLVASSFLCNTDLQVQVKSTAPQGVPFFLLLRDPSKHIQSLQENKKFVDNMAETLAHDPDEDKPNHQFSVSVPKADNYFPVMRYKCGSELRPVPIVSKDRVSSVCAILSDILTSLCFALFTASSNQGQVGRRPLESSAPDQFQPTQ